MKPFLAITALLIFGAATLAILSLNAPLSASKNPELKIAVASNFYPTAQKLVKNFDSQGTSIQIISGSTGKLFAQIKNGAPFSVFLAADELRPKTLEESSIGVFGTRFTYAYGKLAVLENTHSKKQTTKRIAIANPKIAPYGIAAHQALASLTGQLGSYKLVFAENVGQVIQFVHSKVVDMGFVADSQIKQLAKVNQSAFWYPENTSYQPIKQQAILIDHHPLAFSFLNFLASPEAKKIIQQSGYTTP